MGCCCSKKLEYYCDRCGKKICSVFNQRDYDLYVYEDFIHYEKYKRCKECYKDIINGKNSSKIYY